LLIFYSSFTHLSLSLFYFIQFLYQHYGHQLDLRSFPTRRSSDLQSEGLDDEMLARQVAVVGEGVAANRQALDDPLKVLSALGGRSEEHTSELQSRENLVCRLLLEKKKKTELKHRE